ncbi:site-specific integrase [Pandoraea sputorum]|uniref:tyrosine-type recombinase/integrase n=1 Tax=Pandoraea sputorum TaxID=93222 RepID=UPI001E28A29D|nr:site-specific integrase [Pandoraea sputorum]MCE4059887.1 site-specific integrase [Pandoraea sputorum]
MTLYKRSGSDIWYYEFAVAKVRYRGTTRTKLKREAIAYEAEKRKEVLDDQRLARDGIKRATLHAMAEQWLDASEITHADHKNNVSRVRKLFGDELQQRGKVWQLAEGARYGLPKALLVNEMTQAALVELKAERIREGSSAGTINREITLVRTLMGYAASLNVLMPSKPIIWSDRRNRAASLKMRESRGKLRWLRMDEETRLLAELASRVRGDEDSAADNLDLVALLLDTGARYGEIAEIRWQQVDLDAGIIYVYRSKVDNEGGIRLPLRSWKILKARKLKMERDSFHRSFVFPAQEVIGTGRSVWKREDACRGHATGAIQAAIDACGLNDDHTADRVTPHTFRDTYASRLVQAGVSLLKVSHLLGHADESMTRKYAHLCPDNTSLEAATVLDGLHAE